MVARAEIDGDESGVEMPQSVAIADAKAALVAYVRMGVPGARRFRLVWEDEQGERGVMQIGVASTMELTPSMQRIFDKLAELRCPQKRSHLAKELGLNGPGGQFSIDVAAMLRGGVILEEKYSKKITNDLIKFVVMD